MNLNDIEPLPPVRKRDILYRGAKCLCPNCGKSEIFEKPLKIHRRCPECGMTLERGDGFFLGPLCINYGLVAFFYVAPLLLCGFLYDWLALKVAILIAFIGGVTLPLILYKRTWGLWLMAYYFCLPDELHANRPEDSDDLSFEEESRH